MLCVSWKSRMAMALGLRGPVGVVEHSHHSGLGGRHPEFIEPGEEYDGEDVLRESTRGYLEEAKSTLTRLHEDLQVYTGPFELPDPDEDVRATVARIVEQEVRNVSAG